MFRRAVWSVAVGVLVLAGCTVAEPTGLPLVERPASPERDDSAVLAALRRLDACALLDPAAARVPSFPADRPPRPLGPHRCELTATDGDRVSVRLGLSLTDQDRLGDFYPRPLGGAKAYVERWANRPPTMCFLHLPVSRTLSIRFAAFAGAAPHTGDLCAMAAAFAGAAADRLARTETPRSRAPMADWDPCTMLATVLDDPDGNRVVHETTGDHGIDGCVGTPATGGTVRLTLFYGRLPPGGPTLVAGRPAQVNERPGRCAVRWSTGAEQLAELSAPDCAGAERLAVAAQAAETAAPPVAPRSPLLYRPDEPDLPVAGACGFYEADPARCRPAAPVPVLGIPAVALHAATAKGDVICSLARDSVREHAGHPLRPVVDDTNGCVFVEPTRTIRVTVRLLTTAVSPEPHQRRTTVAGAPAWFTQRTDPPMAVRRIDIPLRHGTLSTTVHTFAGVGSARDDRPDPAHLDIAEAVAQDVLTGHRA